MPRPKMISIWFFIGILLLIYGVLIFGAGLYDLASPAAHPVVLSQMHMPIWWGALLVALGVIYTVRFRPAKGVEHE